MSHQAQVWLLIMIVSGFKKIKILLSPSSSSSFNYDILVLAGLSLNHKIKYCWLACVLIAFYVVRSLGSRPPQLSPGMVHGSEPPKLHGQMISLGSNHLVYQDMYTFKYDFSWVKTNVVSVNLWIIIFASIDLIKDNCDV